MQIEAASSQIAQLKASGMDPVDGNVLTDAENRDLREKCSEFEALLFSCMLRTMRKTVDKAELFHGGHAEDVYTEMLDQEYAKLMSGSMRDSLSEALYKQLVQKHAAQVYDKTFKERREVSARDGQPHGKSPPVNSGRQVQSQHTLSGAQRSEETLF